MIIVRYNRKEATMTIKGHAQTAPKGEDLVCAAASTLGFTLVAVAQDEAGKFLPSISQRSGELRVSCKPTTASKRVMDTIFTGYELLSNQYPDAVRADKED